MREKTYLLLQQLFMAIKLGNTKGQDYVGDAITKNTLDTSDTSTKGKAAVNKWVAAVKARQVKMDKHVSKFSKSTMKVLFGGIDVELRHSVIEQALAGYITCINTTNEVASMCHLGSRIKQVIFFVFATCTLIQMCTHVNLVFLHAFVSNYVYICYYACSCLENCIFLSFREFALTLKTRLRIHLSLFIC
jgi:hypothetical protein